MIKQLSLILAAAFLLAYVKPSAEVAPLPPRPPLCWTKWFNGDHAGGRGDYETLKDLRKDNPGEICPRPEDIQAVTVHGQTPAEKTNQKFYAYNTQVGFICRNEDQKSGRCKDYEVRFRCPCHIPRDH